MNRRREFERAFVLFVIPGAGPSPIGWPLAKLATNGVLVDVGDRGLNGLHGPEVPIVTSAFLLESKTINDPRKGKKSQEFAVRDYLIRPT